jgi:D-alanyl-D-alanine endopeptidase (penicillin-binding protein 7)
MRQRTNSDAAPRRAGFGRWARLLAGLLVVLSSGTGPATAADNGPNLASVHAAVAPLNGSEAIYLKHADVGVPIASVTKLMTALVIMESEQPLDEWLTVVARDEEPPNNAYTRIRIGSRLQRGALLRLALMASENMAAHVLASHHPGGRDAFVNAMNRTAQRLGMRASEFVDPSGISSKNRASAADLVRLMRAAHKHERLREYTTDTYHRAHFRSPHYALAYGNTNPLVGRGSWGVTLSKTGYLDEAGRCLAMVTRVDGRRIIMVLLNSFGTRSPLGDAGRIKRWLRNGDPGRVADAARDYERNQSARYR